MGCLCYKVNGKFTHHTFKKGVDIMSDDSRRKGTQVNRPDWRRDRKTPAEDKPAVENEESLSDKLRGAMGSRPDRPSSRDRGPAKEPAEAETKEVKAEAPVPDAPAATDTAVLTEHTVVSGDNLSAIAKKYYGSADRDKWMAIYEANKATIGDNPSLIRVGQVLQIPKLD
jgi:nucleoid-associated protein YgaU